MNLSEASEKLLSKKDLTKWLKLADKYMQIFREDKKNFSLPESHEILEPVVKYYASRPKGYARYILQLRDKFPRGDSNYSDINKFYRTVLARAIQQERRHRADLAITIAEQTYGEPPSFSDRLQWIARRESEWASRRLAYLAKVRNSSATGKLSREETNELLVEFWEMIDSEITEGVPEWGS